jgi:hypothetical protein
MKIERMNCILKPTSVLLQGVFKLRKWASNNKAVIDRTTKEREQREGAFRADIATKEDESYAKNTVGGLDEIDSTTEHKVLGLNWKIKTIHLF